MVSKLFPTAIIVILALAIFGCGPEPSIDERVPMPTGNSELREQLLSELDRKGIWYNELSSSEIEIEYESMAVVGELFDGMIKKELPPGRSFSPSPEALPALVEALDKEGVTCSSNRVFDKDWLVCDKDDMPLVEETLTKIVTESWEADER